MNILILDSYYREMMYHIRNEYNVSPNNLNFLNKESMFYGTGGSYRHYLEKFGHNAALHIMNAKIDRIKIQDKISTITSYIPYFDARFINLPTFVSAKFNGIRNILEILEVKKPDVIFIQDINYISSNVLKLIKKTFPKMFIIGEIASKLPSISILKSYDLILSSLPKIVEYIRTNNINSHFFKLGFDPRINFYLSESPKFYDLVFVGSFTNVHSLNLPILKNLSKMDINFRFYGKIDKSVMLKNNLLDNYGGEAWGLDMFQNMNNSKIVLNRHSKLAAGYANNMRLFESTGVGSLLLTENSINLSEYFNPYKEVIPYSSIDEIPGLIRNLLNNQKELSRISKNGQIRTLKDHSYESRSKQLINLLENFI